MIKHTRTITFHESMKQHKINKSIRLSFAITFAITCNKTSAFDYYVLPKKVKVYFLFGAAVYPSV